MEALETVKQEIKKAGYTSKQVSVKTRRGGHSDSIIATIRKPEVDLDTIEKIVKSVEEIRYCEASGEILMGCNTYTRVEIADEVKQDWAAPYMDEAKKMIDELKTIDNTRMGARSEKFPFTIFWMHYVGGAFGLYVKGRFTMNSYNCNDLAYLMSTAK